MLELHAIADIARDVAPGYRGIPEPLPTLPRVDPADDRLGAGARASRSTPRPAAGLRRRLLRPPAAAAAAGADADRRARSTCRSSTRSRRAARPPRRRDRHRSRAMLPRARPSDDGAQATTRQPHRGRRAGGDAGDPGLHVARGDRAGGAGAGAGAGPRRRARVDRRVRRPHLRRRDAGEPGCGGFIERYGAIRVSQVCVLLCAAGIVLVAVAAGVGGRAAGRASPS